MNNTSTKYAWYVVSVLSITYAVSFIDRQVMNLMIGPIKSDMNLTDTEISLLIGLAFGIFYTVMGVPIGRAADRYNRCLIISIGISIWCIMTACCGLARNYLQLFMARLGVGIGEAALSPAALSIISDYFPAEKRTLPVSVYNMAIYIGAGLAMILGGVVIGYIENMAPLVLPYVGELHYWQTAFIIIGLPGLLMALLMITVKEPERQEMLASNPGKQQAYLPVRFVCKYLAHHWRLYIPIFLGMATVSIISYMYLVWVPTMYIRAYDWSIRDIGLVYGSVLITAGPIGSILGGWFGNKLFEIEPDRAHAKAAYLGAVVLLPCIILVPLIPIVSVSVFLLFLASLWPPFITANTAAAVMIRTPNQMRAQIYAVYLLVLNTFGLIFGPTSVALVTDYIFADEGMIRYSIATTAAIAGVLCVIFFYLGRKFTQ